MWGLQVAGMSNLRLSQLDLQFDLTFSNLHWFLQP